MKPRVIEQIEIITNINPIDRENELVKKTDELENYVIPQTLTTMPSAISSEGREKLKE